MRALGCWALIVAGLLAGGHALAAGFAARVALGDGSRPGQVLEVQSLGEAPTPGALAFQPDAWSVELVDRAGRVLARHPLASPARAAAGFMPAGMPVLVQFPDQGSAVRATVRDEAGRIAVVIALGPRERQVARARAGGVDRSLGAPAVLPAKARSPSLERQMVFESAGAGAATRACRRRHPALPPEVVVSPEGCDTVAVAMRLPGAVGSGPSAAPAAPAVDRRVPPELVTPAVAKRLLRGAASTLRLSGRVRFAAGAPVPSSPVQLVFWGFDGTGSGAVLSAAPPEFRYELSVVAGVSVDVDVTAPGPFVSTRVPLGTLTTDLVRDIELAAGVSVSGRLVFPAGTTAPTNAVALWLRDGGQQRYFTAQPPEFRFSLGVTPGRSYAVDVAPPAPFLAQTADLGTVTADVARDIPLQRGAVVSGRLGFPAGSTPPASRVDLWLVDGTQWRYVAASPPEFRFSAVATPGRSSRIEVQPPSPYLRQSVDLGTVSGDVSRDIALRRGIVLSGTLAFPDQAPRPTAPISGSVSDGRVWYGLSAAPPDFRFAIALEPIQRAQLQFNPTSPYLPERLDLGSVVADRELRLTLRRGKVFSGVVRVRSSARPSVTVGSSGAEGVAGTPITVAPDTPFQLALAAGERYVEAQAPGFQPAAIAVPPGADFSGELVLVPNPTTENVRLQVNWADGRPVVGARVEIWRGEDYLTSTVAMANEGSADAGRANVALADGDYTLHVWPASEYHQPTPIRLFGRPAVVQRLTVAGDTAATVVVPAAEAHRITLQIRMPPPLPGCSSSSALGRVELLQDGLVVARSPNRHLAAGAAGSQQAVELLVGAGRYQLRAVTQGSAQAVTSPFTTAPGLVVAADPPSPARFLRGVLRDAQGAPIGAREIQPFDDLGGPLWADACAYRSDAGGRFNLPLCEGCGFQVADDARGRGPRQLLRIDGAVDADRSQDIRLAPELPMATLATSGTTRVWGDAEAPLRIVFLAEGYAAERETYTDRNGNGVWDGVLWVDVDADGSFDATEPAATYGTAAWPTAGSDPRLTNEPFVDLNGDGVPSFDDRALFERNVQDYLRGLFSSDVFGPYRHAYQAHALMAYSPQVGMDHGTQWQRDTRYGASFQPERGLIGIDYNRAQADASAALPGFDVVVVMINKPVPYGRVNSFILASGGMKVDGRNDTIGAHEFGHKIGGLADEYSEFQRSYAGVEPGGRNSTRFVRRSMAGWGAMLPADAPARPSRDHMPGLGLFEGSSYTVAGVFRPSVHSVMRYAEPWFNAPSRVHLDRVHVPALTGRPGRLAVADAGDCRRVRVSWDVSGTGVANVVVRRGSERGATLASGSATGTAWTDGRRDKGGDGDFVLVDDASGAVIDIERAPLVRCTH